MSLGLLRSYGWPALICGLPLTVTNQPDLEAHVAVQRKSLCQRIVKIHRLARMNIGSFLSAVEFVHLKSRNCGRLVLCQVERLSRRQGMGPITRANIVGRSGHESSCWRQEPVSDF